MRWPSSMAVLPLCSAYRTYVTGTLAARRVTTTGNARTFADIPLTSHCESLQFARVPGYRSMCSNTLVELGDVPKT
jgi:hypothetical protein